jgi:uncharacterized Zn-binding protein involved in type VI secretion
MGDMTAHGGVIVAGCPTVLIGGQPAARQGDMHTCPIPGAPPPPHVGGPITLGSPTVLIGGMMAARVGDMCTCVGPPDTIIPPGCPTVLIGEAGGGSAGGGAGAGSGGGAQAEAAAAEGVAEGDEGDTEGHYLHVDFEDSGGFPVTGVVYQVSRSGSEVLAGLLSGRVRQDGIESGSYDIALKAIVEAKWSVEEASVGDTVTLSAKCAGIESGAKATLTIILRDFNTGDRVVRVIPAEVSGDKIEADWVFELREDLLPHSQQGSGQRRYSSPSFYFLVEADGCNARSKLLKFKDLVEIRLNDEDGKAIGNRPYRLFLANGEVRDGTLDGNGYAKEENIPPGRVRVSFNVREQPS